MNENVRRLAMWVTGRWWIAPVVIFPGVFMVVLALSMLNQLDQESGRPPWETSDPWITALFLSVLCTVCLYAVSTEVKERDSPAVDTRVRAAEASFEEALREEGPGAESPGRSLAMLWELTHARLDSYHRIAQGQATRSFRNAQGAMVLGFALLVGFAGVAVVASTTAGAVVAGGLGAVSAGLSGFVARTFVRSQETAAGHLRAYFDQPLEFSRYLAAERLAATAELSAEQRAEIVTAMVQAIIAGPNPPPVVGVQTAPGEVTMPAQPGPVR
ncbi:hypothetical protein [Streptomyces sp. H27-D2]|uniref:hypothetical protein n=1 Tax=Streptomyces sp. H27-D2 TaxID=3046304 RepID=UPI002DB88C2D|nr:hypothetical protein [Streptomyces sp. H27-D2]MEC4019381.1 hypothetical protein [Streptomyces sp. H27-D2]